jgi:hypothetical protein
LPNTLSEGLITSSQIRGVGEVGKVYMSVFYMRPKKERIPGLESGLKLGPCLCIGVDIFDLEMGGKNHTQGLGQGDDIIMLREERRSAQESDAIDLRCEI